MCMPGDNTDDDGRADPPDRHGRGPALRHPRGRPHRRLRPRHQDHQVGRRPRMAKANEKRIAVTLECTTCKRRNYITTKNKVNDRERIEMKKYCRWDRSTRSTRRPGSTSALVSRTSRNRVPMRVERPMPQDVADLVAAARDGDREAFDELVRATYAETYTLALRLTGNEEDARDVVQEAYLRAFRGLKPLPRRRAVLDVDVPDHRQLREHPPRQAHQAPPRGARRRRPDRRRPARRPTRSSRPTPPPSATGSPSALEDLPAQAPPGGGAARHLRPAPRGHRRRARDLRDGGQGAPPPGPQEAAGGPVPPPCWRRPPMRCEELADDLAAAADGSVLARAHRAPPRRALPALPGRARAVPQGPAGHAGHAHRGARAGPRACWPTSSPTSRRPASAGRSAR